MKLEVDQYNMAAVPIDSPERSRDAPAKVTVIQFYDVNRRPAVRPEQFLNDFNEQWAVGGTPRIFPYLTDIVHYMPWKRDMAHFLRTVLLSEYKSNLCILMVEDSHFEFPGFLTASWYCKVACSYFSAHVEQLFASSLNVCYMGGTTWWCIKRADLKAIRGVPDSVRQEALRYGPGWEMVCEAVATAVGSAVC